MVVGFLKWLYCMHCVLLRTLFPAQSTFPTALLVSHCCPEKGLAQVVLLPRGLQCSGPVPCAQPKGRDIPSLEELALASALPFSCCFFCHKHIHQELVSEGNAEACLLHQRTQHVRGKLPLVCVWCLWQAARTWRCGLRWASVSWLPPGRSWLQLRDTLGWIWLFFHQLLANKHKEMLI